jgi:ABC-type enterochelin transport system permease subunit
VGLAAVLTSGNVRVIGAICAVGLAEMLDAMALGATYQWRLAPRSRRSDAVVLIVTAALAAVAGVLLGSGEVAGVVGLLVANAAILVVAHRSLSLGDRVGYP